MNSDPLEVALREIAETKRLLENLVGASETFDYFRAKATLEELRLKIRVLARMQSELSAQRAPCAGCIVPFPLVTRAG